MEFLLLPSFIAAILIGVCLGDKRNVKRKEFDAYQLADIFLEHSKKQAQDGYRQSSLQFYYEAMRIRSEEDRRIQRLLTDGEG